MHFSPAKVLSPCRLKYISLTTSAPDIWRDSSEGAAKGNPFLPPNNPCQGRAAFRSFPRMDAQLQQYLPVLILGLFAVGFAAGTLILSVVAGRFFNKKIGARTTTVKDIAYECGMLPIGGPQPRFSVKFYIVAMLFVIFDIDVVFLYPWAVIFNDYAAVIGAGIFWWMLSFIGILLAAFAYAWKKGALRWDS